MLLLSLLRKGDVVRLRRSTASLRFAAAIVAAGLVCGFTATGWSKTPIPARESEVARCIQRAAGGKVWLERTLWGLRDQEGGWIGAEMRNANGSHDLGPLQVNSWWVPRIASALRRPESAVRHWLQHDACFNVDAAQWIFLSGLAITRNYWKAVGVYHSPTAWRQQRYTLSVVAHLRRRFGPLAFAVQRPE